MYIYSIPIYLNMSNNMYRYVYTYRNYTVIYYYIAIAIDPFFARSRAHAPPHVRGALIPRAKGNT